MIRSTLRPTQPNCKVDFTKYTFSHFFYNNICIYQKKSNIFAPDLKNDTKLQQIFNINKLNF